MTRLEEALERLERAVARLEAVASADTAGGGDRLIAQQLADSEAEKRRLRSAAGEIAARVDNALARVGRALEREREA
jgi:CAP N-terminal conserved motif